VDTRDKWRCSRTNFIANNRAVLIRSGKILLFCAAILSATKLTLELGSLTSPPTAAFSFLIIVLLSAYFGDLFVAIVTSLVATLCFDYFYLPPVGTFNIYAFPDWILLVAFLLATVIISRLTASAAESKANATELNETVLQLTQFGEWLSSIPEDQLTLSLIAKGVLDAFSLEFCSIHVYGEGKWQHSTGTAASPGSQEMDAQLKSFEDHTTSLLELADEYIPGARRMPLAEEKKPPVFIVVKGKALPTNAIGTVASIIGLRLGLGNRTTTRQCRTV